MPIGNMNTPFTNMIRALNQSGGNNRLQGSFTSNYPTNDFLNALKGLMSRGTMNGMNTGFNGSNAQNLFSSFENALRGAQSANPFTPMQNSVFGGQQVTQPTAPQNWGGIVHALNTANQGQQAQHLSPGQIQAEMQQAQSLPNMHFTPEQLAQIRQQYLQSQPTAGSRTGMTPAY